MIEMNSSITKAEAYIGEEYSLADINLSGRDEGDIFALRQNQPNPFKETTSIEFHLDKDGPYQMSFYDITGKTLHVIADNGRKGRNIIEIGITQLRGTGMIYYRLESDNKTDTKHMILID
jgi:hypothetical protein